MNILNYDLLRADPRVAEAKTLLLAALTDAQAAVTAVRPADPARMAAYADLLGHCSALRGGNLYYPYLGSGFGKGPLVELADGSVKYDFISGIGPHYWGHCHPELVAAEIDAAMCNTIMQGHLQQNVDSVRLMQTMLKLAQKNGSELAHCFLSTTGATANENALKIIFQRQVPRSRILCFDKCFAGRTLALAMMTDKAKYRAGLPTVMNVDYLPFYDARDPRGSTDRALAKLKDHLARYPDHHAAMCFELVQGEGGYFPGSADFFRALMEVLNEHGIAVWIDEVQTFGRLSEPFAFQHFGLDDWVDVVTIGKLSQVCATLYREPWKPRPGLLSQTFTAATAAIAASQVILDAFVDGNFFGDDGRIARCHQRFAMRFTEFAERYPETISGPFGIGAMIACTICDGGFEVSKTFADRLFENGVIGFIAGHDPVRVRFLPPVGAIDECDIDRACEIMGRTLKEFSP